MENFSDFSLVPREEASAVRSLNTMIMEMAIRNQGKANFE